MAGSSHRQPAGHRSIPAGLYR